jgi:uncharacterized integral membrane protein
MIALILFIAFGLLFSYFATLNTSLITINLGFYTAANIPLYIIILASLGLGTVFASLFYFVKSISYKYTLGQKNRELREKNKEINELTKEFHELEIENAKLHTKSGVESVDDESI